MVDFKSLLLEHLPATVIAILSVVGSILTIIDAVKKRKKKKAEQILITSVIFLIVLLASILYLFSQYYTATTNVLN